MDCLSFQDLIKGSQDLVAREIPERILFAGLEVSIKWSTRRRSIGLTVTGEGTVVIAAPVGVSRALLVQALTKHQAWIKGKLAERREAWARLQEGTVFFRGQAYRLALLTEAAAPVTAEGGEIRIKGATAAAAWPLLRAWYLQEADRIMRERVQHYARGLGLQTPRVELREWKRRWGECHPQEVLRFNWRLILLPPEILDYVAVHELAHLRVPGHTPPFWQEVGKTLPDYRGRRQWLNRYGAPFLLWRL